MTINKFTGKTKEEATNKAKAEFGPNVVIMNVKEIKPKGLFKAFKASTFEVTAAIEEKDGEKFHVGSPVEPVKAASLKMESRANDFSKNKGGFSASADDDMSISDILKSKVPDAFNDSLAYTSNKKKEKTMQERVMKENTLVEEERNIDKRLESLSSMLDEKLLEKTAENKVTVMPSEKNQNSSINNTQNAEGIDFVRILYSTLLENEVNEKYVNQIVDEIDRFIRPGNSVDLILSNVYQKLILRFGRPETIEVGKKPKVIFFIGPTGVGKTTTIAKIASKYKVDYNKSVAFITADTYRIAATEQLQVYANILNAPMSIVYTPEDLNQAVERTLDHDLIFVDTAGFSHKNEGQRADIKRLVNELDPKYDKEVYLVLSATTKYKDLLEIVDIYHEISDYKIIFTKLDETMAYGNILNVKLYSGADLSYVTNGQNVPDDIEVFNTQKIVKQLLGGK